MIRCIGYLLMLGCLVAPVSAQDDKMAETVKGLVKKMIDATVEGDYRTVIDMSHPKVVDMMGGKEAAIQEIEKAMKTIKEQGLAFKIKDIGSPTLAKSDKAHYSATSFTMLMTGLGKKITMKSAVIGVSNDAGKTWKFINLDKDGEKGARTLLPDIPATLVIPKQEQKIEDGN